MELRCTAYYRKAGVLLLSLAAFATLLNTSRWQILVKNIQNVTVLQGIRTHDGRLSSSVTNQSMNNVNNTLHEFGLIPGEGELDLVQPIMQELGRHFQHLRGKSKLMIIAHYRGGSSFVGELFAQNPNIFYMFEPLHAEHRRSKWRKDLQSKNYTDECIKNKIETNFGWLSRAVLGGIANCDFNFTLRVVPGILRDTSFLARDLKLIREVSRPYKCSSKTYTLGGPCVLRAEASCRKSVATVTKTIRARIKDVAGVLSQDPDIRIINYVRDPRGILASRAGIRRPPNVTQAAGTLCAEMAEDLAVSARLEPLHPGRILLLRYEDLALDARNQAAKLYKKLGMGPVPESVIKWINRMSGPLFIQNSSKRSPYSTARNSADTAYKWKAKAAGGLIKEIQEVPVCQKVFKKLGYKLYI